MAQGNTLQIIIFAVLFGVAISAAGKPGERIAQVFNDLNEVIMKLVAMLMHLALTAYFLDGQALHRTRTGGNFEFS